MGKKGNPYMGISKKEAVDTLVGAFEGGSNYWYEIKKVHRPEFAEELFMPEPKFVGSQFSMYTKLDKAVKIPTDEGDYQKFKRETGYHGVYDTLLNGGEIEICDAEDSEMCGKLSMRRIREKTPDMAKKHPKVWGRIKSGQQDASDSDVFLQELLFDEVVFG